MIYGLSKVLLAFTGANKHHPKKRLDIEILNFNADDSRKYFSSHLVGSSALPRIKTMRLT